MATLTVPDQLPPVADDCERLHSAFQGLSLTKSSPLFCSINWFCFNIFQIPLWCSSIVVFWSNTPIASIDQFDFLLKMWTTCSASRCDRWSVCFSPIRLNVIAQTHLYVVSGLDIGFYAWFCYNFSSLEFFSYFFCLTNLSYNAWKLEASVLSLWQIFAVFGFCN